MFLSHPNEPNFYTQKKDGVWGVFANRFIPSKELIGLIKGVVITKRTRTSIEQLGKIIEPTNGMGALNHSCFPNSTVTELGLIAIKDIDKGEEITFDYNTSESKISFPFLCNCEYMGCRGLIK